MKVQSEQPTKITEAPKKLSPEEIKARIKSKFGKDLNEQKAKKVVEDKVEVKKKGVSSSKDENFGDIGSNDPNSELTQSKLKDLLKTGSFQFSERERKALSQILK